MMIPQYIIVCMYDSDILNPKNIDQPVHNVLYINEICIFSKKTDGKHTDSGPKIWL